MSLINLAKGYQATPLGEQYSGAESMKRVAFEVPQEIPCLTCPAFRGEQVHLESGSFDCGPGNPKKGTTNRTVSFRWHNRIDPDFTQLQGTTDKTHCKGVQKLAPIAQSTANALKK
jgi:hypothetical protein